jgi:hypothetical protein
VIANGRSKSTIEKRYFIGSFILTATSKWITSLKSEVKLQFGKE